VGIKQRASEAGSEGASLTPIILKIYKKKIFIFMTNITEKQQNGSNFWNQIRVNH
jgi:hypothetical protein